MSRQVCIPTALLAVLDIVLCDRAAVCGEGAVAVELVAVAVVGGEGLCALGVEDGGGSPAHVVFVEGGVVRRGHPVVVVTTAVHDVPIARGNAVVVVGAVVGIVEVHHTDNMPELVAYRTDTAAFLCQAVDFAGAGVVVHILPVELALGSSIRTVVVGIGTTEAPVVRPYRLIGTAVGFAHTGIEDVHKVHGAVAVVIV